VNVKEHVLPSAPQKTRFLTYDEQAIEKDFDPCSLHLDLDGLAIVTVRVVGGPDV
jgi:hypothetical protein